MKSDVIHLVEAAYRVEISEGEWLAGLAQVGCALFSRGLGAIAYIYDYREERPKVRGFQVAGEFDVAWLPPFLQRTGGGPELISSSPTQWRRWLHQSAGTARTTPDLEELTAALVEFGGARDVFGINGRDPEGFGLFLGVPQPRAMRLADSRRQLYTRVAAHVAAGFRLRRRLGGAPPVSDAAEAVLAPDGSLLHAVGEAREVSAREQLRRAVVHIDRARSRRGRADSDGAMRGWKGLVDGRWTIVDSFEHDGKRFLLAERNDVQVDQRPSLTVRELQVLAYAALDRSDKEIAYELGIAAATVRVLMARAARKLGVSGRAYAIAHFRGTRRE